MSLTTARVSTKTRPPWRPQRLGFYCISSRKFKRKLSFLHLLPSWLIILSLTHSASNVWGSKRVSPGSQQCQTAPQNLLLAPSDSRGGISLKTTNRMKIQTRGYAPSFLHLPNGNTDKFHGELERRFQRRSSEALGEADLKPPGIPEEAWNTPPGH